MPDFQPQILAYVFTHIQGVGESGKNVAVVTVSACRCNLDGRITYHLHSDISCIGTGKHVVLHQNAHRQYICSVHHSHILAEFDRARQQWLAQDHVMPSVDRRLRTIFQVESDRNFACFNGVGSHAVEHNFQCHLVGRSVTVSCLTHDSSEIEHSQSILQRRRFLLRTCRSHTRSNADNPGRRYLQTL